MDISNIKSYEEFELSFEDYKKQLIFEKAQAKTNEYNIAIGAANSFRMQLQNLDEQDLQYGIINNKLQHWEKISSFLLIEEPNISNPNEIVIILTPEEEQFITDLKLNIKKQLRTKLVNQIQVSVGDKVFEGDETSQIRMTRAIQLLDTDEDTITWVLADNQPVLVTKLELVEALKKSAATQVSLWNIY